MGDAARLMAFLATLEGAPVPRTADGTALAVPADVLPAGTVDPSRWRSGQRSGEPPLRFSFHDGGAEGPMTEVRVASPPVTSPRARAVALVVYVGALTAWIELVEVPKSVYQAFAWIWLAVIAWDIRAPWRSHLSFARDWAVPLAVLTFYLYSRGLADDLGFTRVHVTAPIEADRALFGGTLPTEYLQASCAACRACGRCRGPGSRWC